MAVSLVTNPTIIPLNEVEPRNQPRSEALKGLTGPHTDRIVSTIPHPLSPLPNRLVEKKTYYQHSQAIAI